MWLAVRYGMGVPIFDPLWASLKQKIPEIQDVKIWWWTIKHKLRFKTGKIDEESLVEL
jgi:hypothetical protein